MQLSEVIDELVADLPWGEQVRLVVGGLASRESVKDLLLSRVELVPSWTAGTLAELAQDILKKNKGSVDKSLSVASQCDALQKLAARPSFREATSELCTHLKDRSVARKIARFLSALDRSFVNEGELAAVIESLSERDPARGRFVAGVAELWRQGALVPWSEGHVERRLLAWLDETAPASPAAAGLPRRLWLWGFGELTPLEESLLGALARVGVELRLLVPTGVLATLEPRATAIGMSCVALDEPQGVVESWDPHSVWDEIEFLRDALAQARERGIAWRDIALFVPEDDLYKRFVRQKLQAWNVPLRDPALSGAWKDRADWLWWRDLLRALASGLKPDEVRAWLGPGPGRAELSEAVYAEAVHGGVGQWARLARKHPLPELTLLIEAMGLFARVMDAAEFKRVAVELVARVTALLGTDRGGEVLTEFAEQVATERERPYLEGFSARLPRYVPLFEEYLEARARTESVRSDGVQLVGHGVWLPELPRQSFVLGANTLSRARPSVDLWDWESVEARGIWGRVHFGFTYEERARRDEALIAHGLRAVAPGGSVVFSGARHDISGRPLPEAALFKSLRGEAPPTVAGGHARVGWERSTAEHAVEAVLRPDLAPRVGPDEPAIRVSSFEDYLKCPFLYYARHVLKLEPEQELGLDADGRARGTVLHAVLERFLRDEIEGLAPVPVEAERETAIARLRAIVSDELARRPLTGMYRHKPLVDKAQAMILAEAVRWLDWEIANRAAYPALKPRFVEKAIELTLDGGLRVRGKADRIDSDGTHSVVIDYKTGAAPFIGGELIAGTGAQLLMYAQGVRLSDGLAPAAVYYLALGREPNGRTGVFLKKHAKALHDCHPRNSGLFDGEFDELIEGAFERWNEAAGRLTAGDFTARPSRPEKDCPKCRFSDICGYEAEEVEA